VEQYLLTNIYQPPLRQFWINKFRIPHDGQYDWRSYFRSLRTLPPHLRQQTMKFNARILPVGINLKRRRHSESDTCPCCNQTETHSHLYQCSHPAIEDAFTGHLDSVRKYLDSNTSQELRHGVLLLIHAFRYGMGDDLQQHHGSLLLAQYHLGLHAFLAGLWLTAWKDLQSLHYAEHNLHKSVDLWFNQLLHLIQAFPSTLWDIRNAILHNSGNLNHATQVQHLGLDADIDGIFHTLPPQRIMAHCDIAFFQRYDKTRIKAMAIRRKTNWVTDANLILQKYNNLSPQANRFVSFFQWDPG
jgi:hypothetical protein